MDKFLQNKFLLKYLVKYLQVFIRFIYFIRLVIWINIDKKNLVLILVLKCDSLNKIFNILYNMLYIYI